MAPTPREGPHVTEPQPPIEPDTKDWTWVLVRPCAECGTDVSAMGPKDVAAAVRDSLPRWRAALERPHVDQRPDPATWSPLEYGAHVRDVFRVMRFRLDLMLTTENPEFPDWDQDATALEDAYGEQDPPAVVVALCDAGRAFADGLEAVRRRDCERPGRRSNGSVFTVETLAQYAWHDVAHHLHDVDA